MLISCVSDFIIPVTFTGQSGMDKYTQSSLSGKTAHQPDFPLTEHLSVHFHPCLKSKTKQFYTHKLERLFIRIYSGTKMAVSNTFFSEELFVFSSGEISVLEEKSMDSS